MEVQEMTGYGLSSRPVVTVSKVLGNAYDPERQTVGRRRGGSWQVGVQSKQELCHDTKLRSPSEPAFISRKMPR